MLAMVNCLGQGVQVFVILGFQRQEKVLFVGQQHSRLVSSTKMEMSASSSDPAFEPTTSSSSLRLEQRQRRDFLISRAPDPCSSHPSAGSVLSDMSAFIRIIQLVLIKVDRDPTIASAQAKPRTLPSFEHHEDPLIGTT